MSVTGYGGLKFGSLDEVIKVNVVCLDEGKGMQKEGSKLCRELGIDQGSQCSSKAADGSKI